MKIVSENCKVLSEDIQNLLKNENKWVNKTVIIQNIITDEDYIELCKLLKKYQKIQLIIPYYNHYFFPPNIYLKTIRNYYKVSDITIINPYTTFPNYIKELYLFNLFEEYTKTFNKENLFLCSLNIESDRKTKLYAEKIGCEYKLSIHSSLFSLKKNIILINEIDDMSSDFCALDLIQKEKRNIYYFKPFNMFDLSFLIKYKNKINQLITVDLLPLTKPILEDNNIEIISLSDYIAKFLKGE